MFDPAIQFLSDYEASTGTPSLCGDDFDFDDVMSSGNEEEDDGAH